MFYLYILLSLLIVVSATSTFEFTEGISISAKFLNSTHIQFNTTMKQNRNLAIGFGSSMKYCDMVMWQSNYNSSQVQDLYSRGKFKPDTDTSQDYATVIYSNDSHVVFNTVRKLSTGDSQDYIFENKPQEIQMIYSHVDTTYNLIKHIKKNRGHMKMIISQSNNISFEFTEVFDLALVFGWIQFATWTCLGICQIIALRYTKQWWRIRMWFHGIAGTITTACTLLLGGVGSEDFIINFHSFLGAAIMLGVFFLAISGWLTMWYGRTSKWKTKRSQQFKLAKKIVGYFMMIISQLAMVTGVIDYEQDPQKAIWGYLDLVFFFILWLICEVIYQIQIRKPVLYLQPKYSMGLDEFNMRIEKGEQLCILDDMVLDVSQFQQHHPGGKFVISHNIGRDISKFFYGGYVLENEKGAKPYTHGNISRRIVNQLIIGKLISAAPRFTGKVVERTEVNKTTETFTIRAVDCGVLQGVSKYYEDISNIGKHYLIRATRYPKVRRHYTISNCMEKQQYEMYMNLIKKTLENNNSLSISASYISGETNVSSLNLLSSPSRRVETEQQLVDNEKGENEIVVTIKNYYMKGGFSKTIFEQPDLNLEVQGPMGKGLEIKPQGVHVAFTAGTGCLVFLDLVTHLLRKTLGLLNPNEDKQIDRDKFKFILYVSFPNKDQSIGLDLCLGLQEICTRFNRDNFELYARFSNDENSVRWNETFILQELQKYGGDGIGLQRVWVCGPPVMNEMFDKVISKNLDKLKINKHQYEIM